MDLNPQGKRQDRMERSRETGMGEGRGVPSTTVANLKRRKAPAPARRTTGRARSISGSPARWRRILLGSVRLWFPGAEEIENGRRNSGGAAGVTLDRSGARFKNKIRNNNFTRGVPRVVAGMLHET
jgi:hypothetical protein